MLGGGGGKLFFAFSLIQTMPFDVLCIRPVYMGVWFLIINLFSLLTYQKNNDSSVLHAL